MAEQMRFLSEALQNTSTLVESLDDRYREAAFPIILQALIKMTTQNESNPVTTFDGKEHESSRQDLLPNMPVNEFFKKAAPDTHVARFTCAAYYLLHMGQGEQFTIPDILAIYSKLREPKPKNPADVLNQCIRKAYITDAAASSKQKCWVITSIGERYVEGLLNGNTDVSNATSR